MAVPMRDIDHEIWQTELDDFVPARIHDTHVHLFRTDLDQGPTEESRAMSEATAKRGFAYTDMALWQEWNAALFPGREIHGSCMGFPFPHVDMPAMNQFVADEAHKDAGSAPFMLVRPGMPPAGAFSLCRRGLRCGR